MKNVRLGKPRGVEHHMFALVHPAFARRLSGMAISAPLFAISSRMVDQAQPDEHMNETSLRLSR